MADTKWLKQTPAEPLFGDLLWSRPENKNQAGKLLIVGGNLHSFTAVSNAYAAAAKAGIGTARILLPDALAKTLGKVFPEAEFAPSTPSGSFGRASLAQSVDLAAWADAVLLAGDFGKNSETAIWLESLAEKYSGPLAAVGDAVDYFLDKPDVLLDRTGTLIVAEVNQLQKLLAGRLLIKHSMNLVQLIEALTQLDAQAALITTHADQVIVAYSGQVSTTPAAAPNLIKLASVANVWWLQNSTQVFEALTTAVFEAK